MVTESEIRKWLTRFLAGEVSLDAFEDWFVQNTWNMHQDSPRSAQQLASAIELRLAEYSSQHLTSEGLQEELRKLVSEKPTTTPSLSQI